MRTIAYKNLTRDSWSLKQGGVVVGHCKSLSLYGVKAKISAKRHSAVRSLGNREVFATLEGDLCGVEGFESYQGRDVVVDGGHLDVTECDRRVTFHPFETEYRGFYYPDNGELFVGCDAAHFTADSKVWVAQ